jgi:hypothetical protein
MSPHRETSDPVRPKGTVVRLFHKTIAAERAIRDLKDVRFTDRQIGVLMRDPTGSAGLQRKPGRRQVKGPLRAQLPAAP